MTGALGLFGGAFDPVHIGHIRGAAAVQSRLELERIDLLPAAQSPFKEATWADAQHRIAMIRAAVVDSPGLGCDSREINRLGPSFTVDTLLELREENGPDCPLIWIIGADVLETLSKWSRWEALLSLAHFVVLARPGAQSFPSEVVAWLSQHAAERKTLMKRPAGGVLLMDQPPLNIASSNIRELLEAGRDVRCLIPRAVMEYIQKHGLYGCRTQ